MAPVIVVLHTRFSANKRAAGRDRLRYTFCLTIGAAHQFMTPEKAQTNYYLDDGILQYLLHDICAVMKHCAKC